MPTLLIQHSSRQPGTGKRQGHTVRAATVDARRPAEFYAASGILAVAGDRLASERPVTAGRVVEFMDATGLQPCTGMPFGTVQTPWGGSPVRSHARAWRLHGRPGYLVSCELTHGHLFFAADQARAAGWSFHYLGPAWAISQGGPDTDRRLVLCAPPKGLDVAAIGSMVRAARPDGWVTKEHDRAATIGVPALQGWLDPRARREARLRS